MLLPTLKSSLRATPLYALARPAIVMQWRLRGRPVPPPHAAKELLLRAVARRYDLDTFVETGTYLGDMVQRMERDFSKVISIEVAPKLQARAQARFRAKEHVQILLGDSAKVLEQVLGTLSKPALFWLDGHYSGGVTGRGERLTPILREVELVLGHSVPGHAILIDDAHCFTGRDDYPTIEALREFVATLAPKVRFEVDDNVIRILPQAA